MADRRTCGLGGGIYSWDRGRVFYTALIAAALWGIVNVIVKPILVILTLPITILTLGLFTLVINALLFGFWERSSKDFPLTVSSPHF